MHLLKRLGLVLSTAFVFLFFSEFFFVNEGPAFDLTAAIRRDPTATLWLLTEFVLWYALPAYVFLLALTFFQVRRLRGIALAGALYGFTLEGVIVWQMYEGLPFTISWTPLGWHMLIDVLLGWYLLRLVLLRERYWQTALFAIGLGMFWGIWATWYGIEQSLLPPAAFTSLVLTAGAGWVLANLVLNETLAMNFQPTRLELIGLPILVVGLFLLQIVPMLPWTVFVLPPLLLLTGLGLWRDRFSETGPTLIHRLQPRVRRRNISLLALTPITAAITYTLTYQYSSLPAFLEIPTLLLMFGGFAGYGLALGKAILPRRFEADARLEAPQS